MVCKSVASELLSVFIESRWFWTDPRPWEWNLHHADVMFGRTQRFLNQKKKDTVV